MERLEKVDRVVRAALDRKAEDVVVLDVRELTSFADTFVLATGRSDRQVRAIADAVKEAAKAGGEPALGVEGYDDGRWVLVDLNDLILHIFVPELREYYDLDRLWGDAPRIEVGTDTRERTTAG